MKKHIIPLFIGMSIGVVLSFFLVGLVLEVAAPSMLFKEITVPYSLDKTVSLITSRINKQEGWHVISVINEQKEIIKNAGKDIGRVEIIKFSNAKLSAKMLDKDESKFMAVEMPLSIAVYEKSDGRVTIGLMNSYMMARLFSTRREGAIMEQIVKGVEAVLGFVHFRFTRF